MAGGNGKQRTSDKPKSSTTGSTGKARAGGNGKQRGKK